MIWIPNPHCDAHINLRKINWDCKLKEIKKGMQCKRSSGLKHTNSLHCFIRHMEQHFCNYGMSLRLQLPNLAWYISLLEKQKESITRTGGLSVASLKIQAQLMHSEAAGYCLAAWQRTGACFRITELPSFVCCSWALASYSIISYSIHI